MDYLVTIPELLQKYGADPAAGLSPAEAELRLRSGRNELEQKAPPSLLRRLVKQLADPMIILLLIVAAVSTLLALFTEHGDWVDSIVILAIVVINASIGTAQESRAEKALEALRAMQSPQVRVLRGGAEMLVDTALVVPGDIVLLEAGSAIPADGRILESASLRCDESILTGESVPSEKDAAAEVHAKAGVGDRHNMVFSGCSVVYGRARVLITSTGMHTEIGNIAAMLQGAKEPDTPLQVSLARLGRVLAILSVAACAAIFALGLWQGQHFFDILLISISLAVAAIPEGLPAIVSIVLAMGVFKMAKRGAIVKRLPAVETLGSASIICSDKTGTLTQNKMTVMEIFDGSPCDIAGGAEPTAAQRDLLRLASACCDAAVSEKGGEQVLLGDPTETAILAAAIKVGLAPRQFTGDMPRLGEIPFDSVRKRMTTVNSVDGRTVVIVKGAFDVIAPRCQGLDPDFAEATEQLARRALRVLAVATKTLDSFAPGGEDETLETGLTMVGLIGMIDPPRPEVKDAVATCRSAGIRAVMITGDHLTTASAIARELGILRDGDLAITGAALQAMGDEQFQEALPRVSVYARVSPEDKIRIVRAWQARGEIVSMTGDGVNDAPALKAADIGCAMGIAGTDVSKGAAAMILTDDNFATIVAAVNEGRGIFDNIKKAIVFLLSSNIGEVLTVMAAMLIGWGAPLGAIHHLFINLVTDGLPALALGMDPVEGDVMKRRPRPKSQSVFAEGAAAVIGLQGVMYTALTLIAYGYGRFLAPSPSTALGSTMAFFVLGVSQLFQVFAIRYKSTVFSRTTFNNPYLLGAFAASFGLMVFIALVPFFQGVFDIVPMSGAQWAIALGLSFAPVLFTEIAKVAHRVVTRRPPA